MPGITRSQGLAISLLVALACGFYAIYLGQDKNWDLLNYHLYNPYAFLNDRIASDLGPAGLQTWFSPMLDLIYFSAVSNLPPKLIGFLIGFLQGLNFYLLYRIAEILLAKQTNKRLYALLLALAGILTVGFQAEIGTAMHDSLVALLPMTSLLLILTTISRLDETEQGPVYRLILIAGLISGIAIGFKLVTAISALPLCLALLILPIHWLRRFTLALLFGLATLVGMFAIGGYWMAELWALMGNPLFPQFNNLFHGELATFEPIRDVRFLPKTFFDKVFYPIIFTFDPQRAAELKYEQFSWLIAYFAILVLFLSRAIAFIRKRVVFKPWNTEMSYLLAFFCISFFLWVNIFGIYRYLIMMEMLIPILIFIIVTYIIDTNHSYRIALGLVILLTVVNLPGAPSWGRAGWADTVYSIEPSELTSAEEPANIFLAGQPVAWIIPAMDLPTAFIQIVPNFPISEAYWQRAKMLAAERSGKSFVVFASDHENIMTRAAHGMMKLGVSVDENSCDVITAYLGADKSEYRYCEVKQTESD